MVVERVGQLGVSTKPNVGTVARQGQQAFSKVLERRLGSLRLSAHAQERIESRNIRLSDADIRRLEAATDIAAGKGAREALFLLDDLGFIVSVENRTVITALDRAQLQGNVVTNIDSTVIA